MDKKFTGCEIVQMGIQIEKNGRDFFSFLSESAKNEKVKDIFQILSEDDAVQMAELAGVFGNVCKYDSSETYPDEYFAYMNYLATSYVFTEKDKLEVIAKEVKTDDGAIKVGIRFVKDSILFYEGMLNVVVDDDKEMVRKLIEEEKKHLGSLCEVKNYITGEGDTCGL